VKHLKLKHTFHSPNIPTLTCFQQSLHDECQQYLYSSLNLMKCPCRPQHLLVTGPSGIGKTTFISNLTENLAFSKFQICSAYINCVTLKGKRPDVIKNKIQEATKYLQGLSPSILILDNLDSIAGPVDEERQADDSSANFPVWMKDFLRSTTETCSKTLVIASAESIENLHPTLHTKKGSHPLLKSVTLNPPSADERIKMIKFCLELDNIQFNNQTIEGFYPCDIRKICEKMSLGDLSPADISRQIEEFIPISKWGKSLKPKLKRNIDNVGGLAEAKETLLQTILWPTKFRHIFNKIGVKMPKGVLLYGVPGSGKTLLAESFANFSSLNFIQVKGPELLSKYIGASEGNVRDLFLRAQAAKPCLIFFDEFDSLAPKRGHDSTGVTDRVVNQLLTQLDGVEGLEGVYIIAASSRPDLIDPALLRPGRIDKSVLCPVPNEDDRVDILRKLTMELSIHPDVSYTDLAKATVGFTGADLKGVLYTARQAAAQTDQVSDRSSAGNETLTQQILLQAIRETKPSVASHEMDKYNLRYSNFRSGKSLIPTQRATLA